MKLAVVILLVIVLVGGSLGALALVQTSPEIATEADIETDEQQLGITTQRLSQVGEVIGALPTFSASSVEGPQQLPCRTDSGQLFQPAMLKAWRSTPDQVESLTSSIANELSGRGWIVEEIDQAGFRQATFTAPEGWTAAGSIFSTYTNDAAVVQVRIRDAEPCRL